jgi:hypothetical protein
LAHQKNLIDAAETELQVQNDLFLEKQLPKSDCEFKINFVENDKTLI